MISKEEILKNIDALRYLIVSRNDNIKYGDTENKELARYLAIVVNYTRRKYKIQSGIYLTEEIAAMSKATELDKYM